MRHRSLTILLTGSLLLAGASTMALAQSAAVDSLRAAPAPQQKPPQELNSPTPDPRRAFREGLAELRRSMEAELIELRVAVKSDGDGSARAVAEAKRVKVKQRYERALVQLQLDLARAQQDVDRIVELEALQQRVTERHARSEGGSQ